MVRAALLRRSCDGVAAATESLLRPAPSRSFCASRRADAAATELMLRAALLRRSCADQLRRAHSARRVRNGADAAATELMLLRRSWCCCDGADAARSAAATELRRPAPSRSVCASRLDATRWMRSQHHFPSCWF